MSKAEENLAEDLQRTGGDAWSRLQGQIISNLVDKETTQLIKNKYKYIFNETDNFISRLETKLDKSIEGIENLVILSLQQYK